MGSSSSVVDDRALPLRERKKLRTRRALADAALRLFSERGYDAVTLDDIVDVVEVSKRTFFRNYASKEDVALAADKELWSAYLEQVARCEPASRPIVAVLRDALIAMLGGMDDDWERRFLATHRLKETNRALVGHCLLYCAEVRQATLESLTGRVRSVAADDPRLGLAVEVMLAAWHCAEAEWVAAGGAGGLERLVERVRHAFEVLPGTIELRL